MVTGTLKGTTSTNTGLINNDFDMVGSSNIVPLPRLKSHMLVMSGIWQATSILWRQLAATMMIQRVSEPDSYIMGEF